MLLTVNGICLEMMLKTFVPYPGMHSTSVAARSSKCLVAYWRANTPSAGADHPFITPVPISGLASRNCCYGVASMPWETLLLSTDHPTMLPELFGKMGYVPCPAPVPAPGASKFTT